MGDWAETKPRSKFEPTKGKSFRDLLTRHFDEVLVDEFRTIKLCSKCDSIMIATDIKHEDLRNPNKQISIFRLKKCLFVKSSETEI